MKQNLLKTRIAGAWHRLRRGVRRIPQWLRGADRDALARELRTGCQRFGYLLEPTAMYLAGKPTPFFPTGASLTEGWRYALDQARTARHLRLFERIRRLPLRDDRLLRCWMGYLRHMGLRRMDEDLTCVTVSAAVRRRYSNTLGLEDGAVLPIDTHPWVLGDSLAAEGSLLRTAQETQKEEFHENLPDLH